MVAILISYFAVIHTTYFIAVLVLLIAIIWYFIRKENIRQKQEDADLAERQAAYEPFKNEKGEFGFKEYQKYSETLKKESGSYQSDLDIEKEKEAKKKSKLEFEQQEKLWIAKQRKEEKAKQKEAQKLEQQKFQFELDKKTAILKAQLELEEANRRKEEEDFKKLNELKNQGFVYPFELSLALKISLKTILLRVKSLNLTQKWFTSIFHLTK
jgi:hypothetical protein